MSTNRFLNRRLGCTVSIISLCIAAFSPVTSYAQDAFAQGEEIFEQGEVGVAASPASSTTTEAGTTELIPQDDGGFKYIFTDPRGVVTSYVYNESGQILSEDAPEQGITTRRYSEDGQLIGLAGAGGMDFSTTYETSDTGEARIAGLVARANGKPTITTSYGYDDCENGQGRICTVEHNMHRTSFAYTPDGQLASRSVEIQDEPGVETLQYTYRDDGNLDTMIYPSGLVVSHVYSVAQDGSARVSRITGAYTKRARNMPAHEANFTIASDITYDAEGLVTGFTHGNGVRTELEYDSDGQLLRTTVTDGNNVLDTRTLTYDADDRITAIARLETALNRTYAYDQQGRLVSEKRGDGSRQVDYGYDASHNRVSRTVDGRSKVYNYAFDSNRLVSQGRRGNKTFDYDIQGNLLEDRGGKRRFTYDATNRLSAFYKNGELRASYDYDSDGRRIRKRLERPETDGTKSVRFLHDVNGRLVSETARRGDRGALKARDTIWLGAMPLVQVDRRVRPNGTTRRADVLYLQTDHNGAVRWARDSAARMVWSWEGADAYGGKLSGESAIDRDPDGDGKKVSIPLRFPGQYHDRESGLYHNHHRDYDPQLARYVQTDPIGLDGGINRYAYVKGDPVNYVDPNGLEATTGATAAAIIAALRFGFQIFGGLFSSPPRAQTICLDNPAAVACEPAPGPGLRTERSFSNRLVITSPLLPSNGYIAQLAIRQDGLYDGAGQARNGTHIVSTPSQGLGIVTRTVSTQVTADDAVIDIIRDRTMPGHPLHPTEVFLGVIEEPDGIRSFSAYYQLIIESDSSTDRDNIFRNLTQHISLVIGPTRAPVIETVFDTLLRSAPHSSVQSVITQCSADTAFDILRGAGNSAPGAPFAEEGVNRVILTGNNPIVQTVDVENRTITNRTDPAHFLNPGSVEISVEDLGGNFSRLVVDSSGTGRAPEINNFLSVAIFGQTLQEVEDFCAVRNGGNPINRSPTVPNSPPPPPRSQPNPIQIPIFSFPLF